MSNVPVDARAICRREWMSGISTVSHMVHDKNTSPTQRVAAWTALGKYAAGDVTGVVITVRGNDVAEVAMGIARDLYGPERIREFATRLHAAVAALKSEDTAPPYPVVDPSEFLEPEENENPDAEPE